MSHASHFKRAHYLNAYRHYLNAYKLFCAYGASTRESEDLPVLQEEVEAAVRCLKTGKSPGVDNVPSELLKHGGEVYGFPP